MSEWMESVDPTSGRTFYANRYTRTTQWDPPPGWATKPPAAAPSMQNGHNGNGTTENYGNSNSNFMSDIARASRQMESTSNTSSMSHSQNGHQSMQHQRQQQQQQSRQPPPDPNALPEGWEEMSDATTGRKFYIDHRTQTTTWERPTASVSTTGSGNVNNGSSNHGNGHGNGGSSTDNGFGFDTQSMMKLNQHGSHSRWDDDPHTGSRSSKAVTNNTNHHNHNPSREDNVSNNNGYNHNQRNNSYGDGYTMGLDSGRSSHVGPPPLDFVVVSVPDALRMTCPGCRAAFTYTKRRHHCRLCGDVFCDACSTSRTVLPLSGPEYDSPVRVCDCCMKDVKKGNYFSLRRYLTPLTLYDPNAKMKVKANVSSSGGGSGEASEEITANTVAASLSSLSSDIDAMVNEPMTFSEKITIPASVLVPAVGKHLKERTTAEYAIRVLSSLLMLGNVVGDDSFAMAMYECGGGGNEMIKMKHSESTNSVPSLASETSSTRPSKQQLENMPRGEIVNDVLSILEWNGSDSRTWSALEQAAKVIYYITEPSFIEGAISKYDATNANVSNNAKETKDEDATTEDGPVDVDAVGESIQAKMDDLLQIIDIHRAFRSMLDHATSSASPSLQRWATATLRHLIAEDQRRACSAMISTQNQSFYEAAKAGAEKYESFMTQLVSTGGIMILCSLLALDDAETRTHATSTLEAIVIATREIGLAQGGGGSSSSSANNSNGGLASRVGRGTSNDSAIVNAIVSNGGCGPSLAHLLISSEESVAMMGCSLAQSLLSPLLTDPRGSGKALQQCVAQSDGTAGFEDKDDGLSAYRTAALALVVGEGSGSGDSCLPSLIQILRSGVEQDAWGRTNSARSMKLQVVAGDCLAAISLAIGHILGSARGDDDYVKAMQALQVMESEHIYSVAYQIVTSPSSMSLDPTRDTPQSRLREAAGITLLALSSCSESSAEYLISNKAVSQLLNIAGESFGATSALRGDWASRGLCYLETAAMLLLKAWQNNDESCVNMLIDALDANAVGLSSRLVKAKVHLRSHDQAYSSMRMKIAVCYMIAAMFGISSRSSDNDSVGASRLYSAIDAECAAALAYGNAGSEGRTDLMFSTVSLLSATLPYAHRFANQDGDEPLPMMDLTEACLLAVGSMCGGEMTDGGQQPNFGPNSGEAQRDKYSHLRQDAAAMASKALLTTPKDNPRGGALLPQVLIGALGSSLINPALRLTLAISQNGSYEVRSDLARSGMLVPVGDIMQQSLSSGERDTFSTVLGIVRYCGPCCSNASSSIGRGSNGGGSIATLQNAVRTLACVLMMPDNSTEEQQRKQLQVLKHEALLTFEALSSNEALHSTVVGEGFPALTSFLMQIDDGDSHSADMELNDSMVCLALKTIQSIISIPSSTSSAAAAGMVSSLVKILNASHDGMSTGSRKQEVSLELLHAIALGKNDAIGKGGLLSSGVLEAIASLLGEAGISSKMTSLGIDLIAVIVADIDSTSAFIRFNGNSSLGNDEPMLRKFVDEMAGQTQFLRSLIATMVSATMKESNDEELSMVHPSLYGAPLLLQEDHGVTYSKVIHVLFTISSLLCTDPSGMGKEHFLNAFMLKNVRGASETVAYASCVFLQTLMDEVHGMCVPQNNPSPVDKSFFLDVKLPTVRSQMLEILNSSLDECMLSSNSRQHAEKLIYRFKLPQLCLLYCQSNTMSRGGFDLYENIVLPLPIEMIGELLLSDKVSLVSLFDLVTGKTNRVPEREHSKHSFALTLGNLAKAGLLSGAVERFGVRNNAIAALSAAMMQGAEDGTIDDNEDSLPRICVESLAVILLGDGDGVEITALEAKTMATVIGQTLSKTVLNRFFTQASLESTSMIMDHASDRSVISQSPEARLLCSMASHPETLEMLRKVGGLEAIGLIAHEGELPAICAVQKACDLNPEAVVDVDCHLSIMDALIQVENKLDNLSSKDVHKLREVAIRSIQIITKLSQDAKTKRALLVDSEQSFGCLTAAACIVSASSKVLTDSQKPEVVKNGSLPYVSNRRAGTAKAPVEAKGAPIVALTHIKKKEERTEDLQLGDLVFVDSVPPKSAGTPPKSSHQYYDDVEQQLEGVVAHLGPVQFAPGDDWIGVRLTGSSIGQGRNDGTVKGVHYFDVDTMDNEEDKTKNGVFVKRNYVKRKQETFQPSDVEPETEEEAKVQEMEDVAEDTALPLVDTRQEQRWGCLLVKDDFALESAAFSLLLSFSSSKPHRDVLMKNESLIKDVTGVIQQLTPTLINFQCNALDLLISFTYHLHGTDANLAKLFGSVIEGRTRVLQMTRDKREQLGSKRLLILAFVGLQNMTSGSFVDSEEMLRLMKLALDLFVFSADSLFKGPKSRRIAASAMDGELFYQVSSFFVLWLGWPKTDSSAATILTVRFVSSLMRFIMMTAGVQSLDCYIPIKEREEGYEYWNAALAHCLYYLSCNMVESSQDRYLEMSFGQVIADVEASSGAFQLCLKHIANIKLGTSSISAKQISARLDRLP